MNKYRTALILHGNTIIQHESKSVLKYLREGKGKKFKNTGTKGKVQGGMRVKSRRKVEGIRSKAEGRLEWVGLAGLTGRPAMTR